MENTSILIINSFVVIILIGCIITGWIKGFLLKLLSIASFFVVGIISWWLSTPLSNMISLYPKEYTPLLGTPLESSIYQVFNRFSVFLVLFVILFMVVLVLRPIIKMFQKIPVISTVNKALGAGLGGVQAILFLCIIAFVLRLPIWPQGSKWVEQSLLKYSDIVMSKILFQTKDYWKELEEWNERVKDIESLSPKETEKLKEWFSDHNDMIEKEDLDTIPGV